MDALLPVRLQYVGDRVDQIESGSKILDSSRIVWNEHGEKSLKCYDTFFKQVLTTGGRYRWVLEPGLETLKDLLAILDKITRQGKKLLEHVF
ncbi:hypothetical protein TNCV_3941311 [Trichonephila clavipes]|uniref:Uncharacterized protein n=1 Tax=Trichonephila clavipes TaxID=2585209 RepID=A0A8X6VVS0_TRICX|nr:hypothetical protein TNCV_3941311 [Trichonephila clavipes]